MQHTFTLDQRVYSADGRAGMYVAEVVGGHAVQPLFEDGDGVTEPAMHYAEGIEVWPSVHAEPPRALLDAAIAAQRAALAKLQAEVAEMERAKREAMRSQNEVKERLKQHTALRYIDDHLAGKFTLFVRFTDYGVPTIEDAQTCLANDDRRDKGLKLLSLFGDTKGDLQWRINRYSDGSGNWAEAFPVATQEEGIAEIRRRYELHVAEWRERTDDRKHYGAALAWAKLPSDWLTPPDDVREYIRAKEAEALTAAAAKARKQYEEAQQALAELQQPAAA